MPKPLPPWPTVLCELLPTLGILRTYPLIPYLDNLQYMEPKYKRLRCIQIDVSDLVDYADEGAASFDLELEDILDSLPGAFVKRWRHGLGLTKKYLPIIGEIERLGSISELHLDGTAIDTCVEGEVLRMSIESFLDICKSVRQIDNRANMVAMRFKRASVYNAVAAAFNLPPRAPSRPRHPMIRLFSDEISGAPALTDAEQKSLVRATVSQARALAKKNPQTLAELRLDVDVANLDELIQQFSLALSGKHPEAFWQKFFQRNPFALHLAFGCPLIEIQGQASVGGTTISGREGRLADFLAKNSLTGNIAIFEIKKPETGIISKNLYRTSVYPPTTELMGAIGQVLDQKGELIKMLPNLKEASQIYDIYSYSVQCCVIVGRMPNAM